jgi:hypothetical protein
MLRSWVKAVATRPNAWTVLMGDTMDCARTHFRNHVRGYRQDSNSQHALDDYVRKDVADLAKALEPIKGRIAGAILGNHFWEFMDGTNSEQYLCQLLGIPYLGAMGVIRAEFRDGRSGKQRASIVVFVHHHGGSKGGRLTGGDVNALERTEGMMEADIYALAHTHRRYATRVPRLRLTTKGKPQLIEDTKVFVRCGAFLKGFGLDFPEASRAHSPSYAETQALRPTDLGWVEVGCKFLCGDSVVTKEYTVTF